jgi:alpha-tubulin suppressor-like RCC1 family protein
MCCFVVDGNAWSWGSSRYYQLGHNSIETEPFPRQISNLKNIIQISCGWKHVIVCNQNGQVFGWGNNRHGNDTNHLNEDVSINCFYLSM